MKFKVLWIAGLMLAGTGFVTPDAAQGAMVISNNSVGAYLNDNDGNNDASDFYNGTSIPVSHLVDATAGGFYSRIQLDYAQSGNNATISNGISQKRDGGYNDYAQGYADTNFSVDANTTYDFSGTYSVNDVTSPGQVYLEAYLIDTTNSSYLAYSLQVSNSTNNESFTLGVNGGDDYNNNFGNFTGNLIAGHDYLFSYQAFIYALSNDGGASATGNVTLTLGSGAAAVPEPASIAMWGLGAIGLAFVRRKRKQHSLAV